ncbi:MAG: beta-galactosidase trimerization domain-containing protein [Planctomycetota bacterium]
MPRNVLIAVISMGILLTAVAPALAQLAADRMSYPKALSGRFEPRQDLPDWMRAPRWCTTDSPRYKQGETATLIQGYADRQANVLRLGTFWGGVAMFPSGFAPQSPNLVPGVDPLGEAVKTVRERGMHLLAYINPNAYWKQNPLYETACLMDESGGPWAVAAYGKPDTRLACSNHPAFAEFYTKAIREVVGKYGADGIYVDGLSPHVCYCAHCREKFKRDTGRDLPPGLTKALGPLTVLWEMTSDWDLVGDVQNPDHVLYSRWLMKCLRDLSRLFRDAARAARPGAVVVFHSWPKPDVLEYYDGTLNEIYAKRPWNFTLWKRAEFSNWGDVFEVPSLVNIYLRQEPWGQEKRKVESEVEARHMYWQALANGGFPNAWAYPGMDRPFDVMKQHADCFDFPTIRPLRSLALPRPMFIADARHRRLAQTELVPLRKGGNARLRILEREPNGKIDMLCLRADGKPPTDEECRASLGGRAVADVIYLKAAAFDPKRSVAGAEGASWTVQQDAQAISGTCVTSTGHEQRKEPRMPLEYPLPEIASARPWMLWARVVFPNAGSDSFYWQVSNDGGETWLPETPGDDCALGWEQPQEYAWVQARIALKADPQVRVNRFLSPAAGMFAGLLHAGLPVKEIHPNHINRQTIEGFRGLILANEVCLSDEQCAMIRDFVREGGALIATHETSLYDLDANRRDDFGLADVFGVSLRGAINVRTGQMLVSDGDPLPPMQIPNHEMHLEVGATGAKAAARLTGPGAPEGGLPAVTLNEFGKGRVVYIAGRPDSSYALWRDAEFPALLRAAVLWACRGDVPAQVIQPLGTVGLTCFDQPSRGRWLIHLLSYNADWVEPFDRLPPLDDVRVLVRPPEGKMPASARAVLGNRPLVLSPREAGVELTLPQLEEYEIIEVLWQ